MMNEKIDIPVWEKYTLTIEAVSYTHLDVYKRQEHTKAFLKLEGFIEPTPIQQEVLPLACKGKNIVGISDTGTGKTHAFLIPIFEKINIDKQAVQAVITAPTRELALQIYQRSLTMKEACPKLAIRLITGGMEKTRMNEQLKVQPHIVIGTPGRIKAVSYTHLDVYKRQACTFA